MGVFSKLKNIFYDEEVIEEKDDDEIRTIDREIRREVERPKIEEIKVVKKEPEVEEKKIVENNLEDTSDFGDRELFRREKKFNFTEFDDEELPQRKSVLEVNNMPPRIERKEEPVKVQMDTPKVFKPSPVISPIFGVLDKDYKKEEIVSKKTETLKEIESPASKYDSVRRKAYGTLEDDLEDTLNSMNKITPDIIKEEIVNISSDVDELENKSHKIEDLIDKIENASSNVSVGELEDKIKLENFDEDSDKTMTDSTLEHDLFNLIDSMYDDKEE